MADRVMHFAFTHPTPEREAIITTCFDGLDVSWPITTEAQAYKLAKKVGALGFWRIKCRHDWIEATHLGSSERKYLCAACNARRQGVGQSLG